MKGDTRSLDWSSYPLAKLSYALQPYSYYPYARLAKYRASEVKQSIDHARLCNTVTILYIY